MFRRAITRRTRIRAQASDSAVRRSPSSSPTVGSQPSVSRAAVTSAHESRMSPARGGAVPPLDRLAEDPPDRVGDLVDARRRARRDVEDRARSRPRRSPARSVASTTFATYVKSRDCSPSPSIVIGSPRSDRGQEERDHRRVLRVRALARAEDVEVAQDDGLEALVDAREADAVALGRELRDAVRRDRVGRRPPRSPAARRATP